MKKYIKIKPLFRKLMKPNFIQILILIFIFGCSTKREDKVIEEKKEKQCFKAFTYHDNKINDSVIYILSTNDNVQNKLRLFGVGWYEYSQIENQIVYFKFEDHGKILEKRKSTYKPKDLCDIYKIIYQTSNDKQIECPTEIKNLTPPIIQYEDSIYIDEDEFSSNFKDLRVAKYYSLDFKEPGFIFLSGQDFKSIIYAKLKDKLIYFKLINDKSSLHFILVPINEKILKLF